MKSCNLITLIVLTLTQSYLAGESSPGYNISDSDWRRANNGDAGYQILVGRQFANYGINPDFGRAIRYMNMAIRNPNAEDEDITKAYYYLGRICRGGFNKNAPYEDKNAALSYFQKMEQHTKELGLKAYCDYPLGGIYATREIGKLLLDNGNAVGGLTKLKEAANYGDGDACAAIGNYHYVLAAGKAAKLDAYMWMIRAAHSPIWMSDKAERMNNRNLDEIRKFLTKEELIPSGKIGIDLADESKARRNKARGR